MPLDLHPKCLAQLQTSLTEQLKNARIHYGKFLVPDFSDHLLLAQTALPASGKIYDRLLKLISEAPLVDFVYGSLARELFETQEFQSEEAPIPLEYLSIYASLPDLAKRLVEGFKSLPWTYRITAPLPDVFSNVFCEQIGRFDLSENSSITCGDEEFSKKFPLQSGIEKRDQLIDNGSSSPLSSLLIVKKAKWKRDQAYLQVSAEGFIGKFISTEPLLDAVGLVRAFYGLGLALKLFNPTRASQTYPQAETLYIHRQIDNAWIIEDVHDLDPRHSEIIRNLRIYDFDGALDTQNKLTEWVKRNLLAIGATFRAADRARNILLGAQWLLDSYCGNDELLQFVQAAVVVEILLGEKASSDQTGLGELLANRCAYLIATSHAQRGELLQDFRSIYEVRSKIVHRGKIRLTLSERRLFSKLRWICHRIIQEEVKLLAKDED